MDDVPIWRQNLGYGALEWRGCEIARVCRTAQGDRWLVHVGVHRRDYQRHHAAYRRTEEAACSSCLAWWRKYAEGIADELPRMVSGPFGRRREYPDSNPPGPTSK